MLDDRPYMRTAYRGGWSMTIILCVTLAACYLAQVLLNGLMHDDGWALRWLALSGEGLSNGRVYQLVTFQFLHGSFMHLLFNLIGLYIFGRAVENVLGGGGMLKLYLVSGTIGGLLQVALQMIFRHSEQVFFGQGVVGASAGVFGLIAAFATHAPETPIMMLFLPITFPAKVLLIFEGVLALVGVLGPFIHFGFLGNNVAHAAHLGGMLTGIVWMRRAAQAGRPFEAWQFWRQKPATASKNPWRNSRKRQEDVPAAEFMSREVDPILEKISAHGIHSLTPGEREILEAARSKMARR
jgi:membrane associated rhomboid family serine protease